MVSPEQKKSLGVLDLICEEKEDALEGLLSSVDVISEEEIVFGCWVSEYFEKVEQV